MVVRLDLIEDIFNKQEGYKIECQQTSIEFNLWFKTSKMSTAYELPKGMKKSNTSNNWFSFNFIVIFHDITEKAKAIAGMNASVQ